MYFVIHNKFPTVLFFNCQSFQKLKLIKYFMPCLIHPEVFFHDIFIEYKTKLTDE
jgi:hypothetical protein